METVTVTPASPTSPPSCNAFFHGLDPQAQKGLGMRMVLSLVEQMEGNLTAKPSGQGACFVIAVPHPRVPLPIS